MEQTRAEAATAAEAATPAGVTEQCRLPRRHSVRGQVLAALRDALQSGELTPDRVHSAPALADRFGVSPTPVREAMQQLASEGLVETVPNRGFRVVEPSAREAAELAQVRALLEIPPVLELARSQPASGWDAFMPYAEATVTAASRRDVLGYAAADRAFHRALLELTGNHRLVALVEDVQRRAFSPRVLGGLSTPALLCAAREDLALLDALRNRDTPAVERTLREHLAPVFPSAPGGETERRGIR